jgi:hypothetical protein
MKRLGTLLLGVLVGFSLAHRLFCGWTVFKFYFCKWPQRTTIELGSSAGSTWTYSASGTSKGYYSDLSGSIISPSSVMVQQYLILIFR